MTAGFAAPFVMDGLDAPFAAIREQAPHHIVIVHEGAILLIWDVRLRGLAEPVLPVFHPVVENPDAYLMQRQAPFEELPLSWPEFSGIHYLGSEEHHREEQYAAEQEEDMDADEERIDCTKTSSQDADTSASVSDPVSKRNDSLTDDYRLLEHMNPSNLCVPTIDLQDLAMPNGSPPAFVATLEPSRISSNLREAEHLIQ